MSPLPVSKQCPRAEIGQGPVSHHAQRAERGGVGEIPNVKITVKVNTGNVLWNTWRIVQKNTPTPKDCT
ncbi:MAG: hypothetical protein AMXMBFR7_20970 [Planctomycetota bacterium]